MAQTTPNYGLTIAEGTDTVNLLTQCYPNFTSLDSIIKGIADTGVTTASETKSGTVHQLVRSNTDCNIFRFTATSNFVLGDTFTVDGSPVTAVTVAGASLQSGDFVINSNVLAIVNGGVLTILIGGSAATPDAQDIPYDNSGSGLTASDVQAAIDELASGAGSIDADHVVYDNSGSGLTATDVQAAIDELKTLIPSTPQYITTGLTPRPGVVNIVSGGYYIDNGYVYVDITVITQTALGSGAQLVDDFPEAASAGLVTSIFNGLSIRKFGTPYQTSLVTEGSVSANTTIHFIGSYLML